MTHKIQIHTSIIRNQSKTETYNYINKYKKPKVARVAVDKTENKTKPNKTSKVTQPGAVHKHCYTNYRQPTISSVDNLVKKCKHINYCVVGMYPTDIVSKIYKC